ncbi:MAG TPA: ABC transporter permease [Chitinophaga sp.]|uniref:ABC transporter permease n=1 Tax=Chitinophaga sp. TaxID=1869181 RepID=UPI002F94E4B0
MLKNYLKIALRNLWKHKVFSFINITGLAVGMTACFLIFLYVHFELSYDSFHSKAGRIYRLATDVKTPTETLYNGTTNIPVVPAIKNDFPEVESYVRVADLGILVRKGDLKFQEDNIRVVDSTFFRVFDFKLLKGDMDKALQAPFTVVLTQTTAKKYFGDKDPVGQTLTFDTEDGDRTATVTGLMEDFPENSQIKASMLLSMPSLIQVYAKNYADNWTVHHPASYLLLYPHTNPKTLEAKLPAFLQRRIGEMMAKNKMFYTLTLHPLKEVYLHFGNKYAWSGVDGSERNVYIFSIVAVLILLIACFNFINLTTARAAERAKEVGIRKVVGAQRRQLSLQFIGESIILCCCAFVLTLILSAMLIPLFNQLAGKTVSKGLFQNWPAIGCLWLGAIGIGLLAGSYPAWVLSAFRPVTVLKGRFVTGGKGVLLRKGLVITQFTISLALIAATIIVYRQMSFMRSQDLGFQKDQMLVISTFNEKPQYVFRDAISRLKGVKGSTFSSAVPGGDNSSAYTKMENVSSEMQESNMDLYFVDFDYIDQYKMKLVAGRAFSRDMATDSTQAMVINEATAKVLGYSTPQQAIGRRFSQWGREGKIIGVLKDFHVRSLQQAIKPLTMRIEPDSWWQLSVHVAAKDLPNTMAAIEKQWNALVPGRPFTYNFLDASFDKQYRGEERFGNLFFYFSILAIVVSCLGLLGLVAYSTVQRTKEIGIRKVMGASVLNVVTLLSKDLIKLVLIAVIIAVPVVWYAMYQWLQGFAYRTTVEWWVFALSGLLAVAVALFTISFQSIKAALVNPIQSLRSE